MEIKEIIRNLIREGRPIPALNVEELRQELPEDQQSTIDVLAAINAYNKVGRVPGKMDAVVQVVEETKIFRRLRDATTHVG